MRNVTTISITDYKMISPTLAKVIVAWTGSMGKEEMAETLTDKFSYLAQPVEGSFRKLNSNTAVGFVRANREIRVLDKKPNSDGIVASRTKYRVMSSNILMDNADKTLWEVKDDGAGGQFLARHGNENLAELIEAGTNHKRQDCPKVSTITMAKAAKGEFAAFCGTDGNMDYGFVTKISDTKCQVMARSTRTLTTVPMELVASLSLIPIDKEVHKIIAKEMTKDDISNAATYWRNLFSYAPEYADEMVHYTESDAVL